jgi:hypothetical protein
MVSHGHAPAHLRGVLTNAVFGFLGIALALHFSTPIVTICTVTTTQCVLTSKRKDVECTREDTLLFI